MKSEMKTIRVRTQRKQEMLDITSVVNHTIADSGIWSGIAGIYSQHTTACLFVGEFQSALIDDLEDFLQRIVEEDLPYKHNSPEFSDCTRRNAASHLRSLLLSHCVMLPIVDGKAVFGEFQRVIFAELDGPRDRTLQVHILGSFEDSEENPNQRLVGAALGRGTPSAPPIG